VGPIEPQRSPSGALLSAEPHLRYAKAAGARLLPDGAGPFCSFRIPSREVDAGVYVVTLDGEPVYVGEAQNLAERFNGRGYGSISPRNCYVGGQSTNLRINRHLLEAAQRGTRIELWFNSCRNRKAFESVLIGRLRPEWNRQGL
jgi:hypothetical protein